MIEINEIIKIHNIIVDKFGGLRGLRDKNALDSAINRPFATFDNKELYPTAVDKASAIIESVIKNHPFADGNKRMGYILMRLMLIKNSKDIKATQAEKYKFVMGISRGELKMPEIKDWIASRLTKRNEP